MNFIYELHVDIIIDYYIILYKYIYNVICLHVLRECTYVHSNANAIYFNKS